MCDQPKDQPEEPNQEAPNRSLSGVVQPIVEYGRQPSIRESGEDSLVDKDGNLLGAFNVKEPRDITNGLSHAAQNLASGVGMGLTGLFVCPAQGAKDGGLSGFLAGLGVGVAGAVVAPTMGIATGLTQIVRGAVNQGEANDARSAGKVWDAEKRVWVEEVKITLEELLEKARLLKEQQAAYESSEEKGGAKYSANVKESDLYDILGLQPGPETSEKDIKKAYYRMAMKYHPDKCGDGEDKEEFEDKFKSISEAYQILSDPASRQTYDQHGKAACGQTGDFGFDPSMLFSIIFGSEKLSPLIGEEFRIGALLSKLLGSGDLPDEESLKKILGAEGGALDLQQNLRVLKMAIHLRDMVAPIEETLKYDYLERKAKKNPGKWDPQLKEMTKPEGKILTTWMKETSALAESICADTFGYIYVEALGFAYSTYATEIEGSFLESMGSSIYSKYRNTSDLFTLIKKIITLFQEANDMERASQQLEKLMAEENPDNEKERVEKITELQARIAGSPSQLIGKAVDLGLRINILDVNGSISEAVTACVTKDTSIPPFERKLRATAIGMLGEIFTEQAQKYKSENKCATDELNVEEYLEKCLLQAKVRMDEEQHGSPDTPK